MVQVKWGAEWESVMASRVGCDLDRCNRRFMLDTDLARIVCPVRIVDSVGHVYRYYDPEEDMRLPGPRWRKQQKIAYNLWEEAGRPEGDGTEFWEKAEALIPDSCGRTELELPDAEVDEIARL